MEIIIVDSEAEVASIASDYLAHYANKGGNLGVATGSTPLATYRELIRRHRAGDVTFKDLSLIHI